MDYFDLDYIPDVFVEMLPGYKSVLVQRDLCMQGKYHSLHDKVNIEKKVKVPTLLDHRISQEIL